MKDVKVTPELLENYRSIKDELAETEYKLAHMNDGDNMIGNSVIFDYSTGQPLPQSVVGYDEERAEYLTALYTHRIHKARAEMRAVEEYIESLPDSFSRRAMRLYYIEGQTQYSIARAIGKSQGKVSQIIGARLAELEETT